MKVFAKFDEIPSMILEVIKETKRYGHTFGRTVGRSDNVKTVYPPTNTVCGGYKNNSQLTNNMLDQQNIIARAYLILLFANGLSNVPGLFGQRVIDRPRAERLKINLLVVVPEVVILLFNSFT